MHRRPPQEQELEALIKRETVTAVSSSHLLPACPERDTRPRAQWNEESFFRPPRTGLIIFLLMVNAGLAKTTKRSISPCLSGCLGPLNSPAPISRMDDAKSCFDRVVHWVAVVANDAAGQCSANDVRHAGNVHTSGAHRLRGLRGKFSTTIPGSISGMRSRQRRRPSHLGLSQFDHHSNDGRT